MQEIQVDHVQKHLNLFLDQEIYIHLETTTGSYASLEGEGRNATCAFLRNGTLRFSQGKIKGDGPYSVGLKMRDGWTYAEGLTHWEYNDNEQLLLAGHDREGYLTIALELSFKPFECGA